MGLIYYGQAKYRLAIRNISRLIVHQDFISLSSIFQVKILISELIIRHKLLQTDIIEYKIKEIEKKYKKDIKKNRREKKLLSILGQLIYCSNIYVDKKLQKEIEIVKNMISEKEAENTDVINYNIWLKSLQA